MSAHCEHCGQAKWLSNVFPKVEKERDELLKNAERLAKSLDAIIARSTALGAHGMDMLAHTKMGNEAKAALTDYKKTRGEKTK